MGPKVWAGRHLETWYNRPRAVRVKVNPCSRALEIQTLSNSQHRSDKGKLLEFSH